MAGAASAPDAPAPSTIRGFPRREARRAARGNRIGLFLTGLVLLACGAAGLGPRRRRRTRLTPVAPLRGGAGSGGTTGAVRVHR